MRAGLTQFNRALEDVSRVRSLGAPNCLGAPVVRSTRAVRTRRETFLAVAATALVAGCRGGEYTVTLEFSPPELAASSSWIELALVASCAEQTLGGPPSGARQRIDLSRGSTPALDPAEPGDAALYARAWSSDCQVVAAGCEPVVLEAGGSGVLTVTLRDVSGFGCDAGAVCTGGRCVSGDGGVSDGSACGTCACPASSCIGGRCTPLHPARSVAAGEAFACAIDATGALFCWGRNVEGQLGLGAPGPDELTPRQVGAESTWARLTAGQFHACAIRTDGTLYCWGSDSYGQLGVGGPRATPAQVGTASDWAVVDTGMGEHTCGISEDGSLLCWGDCHSGELGFCSSGSHLPPTLAQPGAWRAVGVGGNHTCAVTEARALVCWGSNDNGALGTGADPSADIVPPTEVGAGTSWEAAFGGEFHSCGLSEDGSLFCWGNNGDGRLGVGDRTRRLVPTIVSAGWTRVATGADHTCAIDSMGGLFCWGNDDSGQLGLGDAAVGSSYALPNRVGTEDGWGDVATGRGFTCAVDAEGVIRCAGANDEGQLGVGDTSPRSELTPVCLGP